MLTREQWVQQKQTPGYRDLIEEIERAARVVVDTWQRSHNRMVVIEIKILRLEAFGELKEMVGFLPENFRPSKPGDLALVVWAEELVSILTPATATA